MRPMRRGLPISLGRVMKAYFSTRTILFSLLVLEQQGSVQVWCCCCAEAELSLSNTLTITPPMMPVMKAAMGLKTAKRGPSRLHVTRMLSAPVWGVESRNDIVDALLAPCLWREIDTGITPQEQSGKGTPKREAFMSGQIPFPPRCFSTVRCEMSTESIPATRKPKIR